jgi:hypothetical protein
MIYPISTLLVSPISRAVSHRPHLGRPLAGLLPPVWRNEGGAVHAKIDTEPDDAAKYEHRYGGHLAYGLGHRRLNNQRGWAATNSRRPFAGWFQMYGIAPSA